MHSQLGKSTLDRLKRESKALAKSLRLKLNEAQDQIAQREGYETWSHLKSCNPPSQPTPKEPTILEQIRRSCIEFIQECSTEDVFRLCWNGSIWICLADVIQGSVNVDSFYVGGNERDSSTRQSMQQDAHLLISFDGLAERFVLPDDEDSDGNPRVVDEDMEVLFTHETGVDELCANLDIAGEVDRLMIEIDEAEYSLDD